MYKRQGKLRDILGIWVEETDALPEGYVNHFAWNGQSHEAQLLCDLLHSEGAQVLAAYEEDFYAGMPVLTRNKFGEGRAYYMATRPDAAGYAALVGHLCREQGVNPVMETPDGVEATIRENSEKRYLFLLNHSGQTRTVTVDRAGTDLLSGRTVSAGESCTLEPTAVMILEY